jgi:hypothetical protein
VFESDFCEYGWETPWKESRPVPGRPSSAPGVQGAKARGVALLGARVALLGARVALLGVRVALLGARTALLIGRPALLGARVPLSACA